MYLVLSALIYIYVCVCVCLCVCIYILKCVYIHIYICVFVCVFCEFFFSLIGTMSEQKHLRQYMVIHRKLRSP